MANDVLAAIGEALIDFIPDKKGCPFSEVGSFAPMVGGAPANVCAAYSKLGGSSRLLTQLGDDPFGHKIRSELADCGIDVSCVKMTEKANTALAFVSLAADGNRTFSFYRNPSADMLYSPDDVDTERLKDVFCLHFCSVSLGDFPMKHAHEKAIEEVRKNGGMISFDLNLRFPLWKSKAALYETVNEFIPLADIIKISDEELEFVTGEKDVSKAVGSLFKGNVKLVVYTCGSEGAYAYTKSGSVFSPARKVAAADTTGAGDGFIGAFLYKFHEQELSINDTDSTLDRICGCLDFANTFCGLSVQKKGAITSYPTLGEIEFPVKNGE